jgi:hypothetical protein
MSTHRYGQGGHRPRAPCHGRGVTGRPIPVRHRPTQPEPAALIADNRRARDLLGWQPSRFVNDRAEAECTYAVAERPGSISAAAAELGTTWPSLRYAFTRHGLGRAGCPTTRARAIIRSADRVHRMADQRASSRETLKARAP